jgi:hypothetical protein
MQKQVHSDQASRCDHPVEAGYRECTICEARRRGITPRKVREEREERARAEREAGWSHN